MAFICRRLDFDSKMSEERGSASRPRLPIKAHGCECDESDRRAFRSTDRDKMMAEPSKLTEYIVFLLIDVNTKMLLFYIKATDGKF